MREWIAKPVNFKKTDPEDMELYRFAGTLPNFTAMAKDWLRGLRGARKQNAWWPVVASHEFTSQEQEEIETEWIDEVDDGQFL